MQAPSPFSDREGERRDGSLSGAVTDAALSCAEHLALHDNGSSIFLYEPGVYNIIMWYEVPIEGGGPFDWEFSSAFSARIDTSRVSSHRAGCTDILLREVEYSAVRSVVDGEIGSSCSRFGSDWSRDGSIRVVVDVVGGEPPQCVTQAGRGHR